MALTCFLLPTFALRGVASAVMMGGAGSVLWMVISAFIAMGVKYAEAFLAVRHRRGCVGNYHGGAPFYIQDACASPRVGRIFGSGFALLCILNSLSTGNLVQVGASSAFLTQGRIFLGIFIAFAVFIVIKGGIKRMQATSSVLIPLLSVLYIGISLFIIFSSIQIRLLLHKPLFCEDTKEDAKSVFYAPFFERQPQKTSATAPSQTANQKYHSPGQS